LKREMHNAQHEHWGLNYLPQLDVHLIHPSIARTMSWFTVFLDGASNAALVSTPSRAENRTQLDWSVREREARTRERARAHARARERDRDRQMRTHTHRGRDNLRDKEGGRGGIEPPASLYYLCENTTLPKNAPRVFQNPFKTVELNNSTIPVDSAMGLHCSPMTPAGCRDTSAVTPVRCAASLGASPLLTGPLVTGAGPLAGVADWAATWRGESTPPTLCRSRSVSPPNSGLDFFGVAVLGADALSCRSHPEKDT
jgi:hypothetical protein